MCEPRAGSSAHQRGSDALKGLIVLRIDLATTRNRARTDALQRKPYCLSSEGVEREYKRTGREEQGLNRQPRLFKTAGPDGEQVRRRRECQHGGRS